MKFSKELKAYDTSIEGLLVFDIPVHGDARGWFKENWQREKQLNLGLPDFDPVQNNISFNAKPGVTRGLHAEPWDKYISVASGRVFGAWCDLREGSPTYGETYTHEIGPDVAIFVPRGVANGFQALEQSAYTYLVNAHWHPDAEYSFVNLADETLDIQWPIPLEKAELSDKDLNHPPLAKATPVPSKKILITGANGQLGRQLSQDFPEAELCTRDDLDLTLPWEKLSLARDWSQYSTIINAAAYTAVDKAEADQASAWRINAEAVHSLSRIANENGITLVHVSTDYVFDGRTEIHHEDEPVSPLNVYGQSKAAGEIAARSSLRHYVIRTSWVIGDGPNFVRAMASLAEKGVSPAVVNDQVGRLTFTSTLSASIKHLLASNASFGVYNVSNSGPVTSWFEIAQIVYESLGYGGSRVAPTSTEEYYAGKEGIAARPTNSVFDLSKVQEAGFKPEDWTEKLSSYLSDLQLKGE